jgi:hypothetical protein
MKYVNRRLTGLVTFCVATAFYYRSLIKGGIEVKDEEDVVSYWSTLRKGEDTLI